MKRVARAGHAGSPTLLVVSLGLCLWVGMAADGGAAGDPMQELKIASVSPALPAPSFTLPTVSGQPVRLTDLAGKVVVMNFWATWCGPCKDEMPAFERLRRRLDPERAQLVTVTTDRNREGIAQFLAGLDVTLQVLVDEDQSVSQSFLVRALPTTVILDRQGRIVGRAVGPRAWDSPSALQWLDQLAEAAP